MGHLHRLALATVIALAAMTGCGEEGGSTAPEEISRTFDDGQAVIDQAQSLSRCTLREATNSAAAKADSEAWSEGLRWEGSVECKVDWAANARPRREGALFFVLVYDDAAAASAVFESCTPQDDYVIDKTRPLLLADNALLTTFVPEPPPDEYQAIRRDLDAVERWCK